MLAGNVATVTGAGSGLGQATAIALAAEGAEVCVTELPDRIDHAGETLSTIIHAGGHGHVRELDVRSLDSITRCIGSLVDETARLDILVNNAGINIRKPALEVTESDWDTVLDVNLKGAFFMAQAAGRQMLSQNPSGGAIINISSIMGLGGYWNRVAYCASKAALINMGRVLALEWGPQHIRVNAVCPNFVITPLTEPLFAANPDFTEDVMRRTPIGRLPTPEEIAAAVVYLASPAAASVTGQALTVDGGWTAH
jgi:2-deoxy-D-gluconate 3-dehydrogenase